MPDHKKQHQQGPNEGIKNYSQSKSLSIFGNFVPLTGSSTFKFSGYKLHIYATSEDDVVLILSKIYDLVKSAGCMMKAATASFFTSTKDTVNPQHGKGITIYLPFNMVATNGHLGFIDLIKLALSGYSKSGNISGDKKLSHNVFYRYELNIAWDKVKEKGGLNEAEYKRHYNPNA